MTFTPEITNDAFAIKLTGLVTKYKPKTIIEIGSANGLGSTQALLRGVDYPCAMYCYEVKKDRFTELVGNVKDKPFVQCRNKSFLPEDAIMSEWQVGDFLEKHPNMNPAQYGGPMVLGWLAECISDLREVGAQPLTSDEIQRPAMALIDGSPFTGLAETLWCIENDIDIIALDDVVDIKCFDADELLKKSAGYIEVARDSKLRNGFAIYARKDMLL